MILYIMNDYIRGKKSNTVKCCTKQNKRTNNFRVPPVSHPYQNYLQFSLFFASFNIILLRFESYIAFK